MNNEYTESEKKEIVMAFIVYLKKVIKYSAIEYIKKAKLKQSREFLCGEISDFKVSLTNCVYDTYFFGENAELEDMTSNNIYKKAISILSDSEKKILYLSAKSFSNEQIAKEMNLKVQTIKNKKSIAKKKIKEKVEEIKNGRNL